MDPVRGAVEPKDAYARDSFQPPHINGNWQPPVLVRTVVWLVKDVGVPVVLTGVFVAAVLGWVDTPLNRIAHIERTLVDHASTAEKFNGELTDGLRKQRCMTAVTNLTASAETIATAALAQDPCVYLEHTMRRGSAR